MKRILIADDSAELRSGLKKLLRTIKSVQVVGEAIDSAGVLKQSLSLNPDIIILDIDLKNSNGIEVLSRLKEQAITATIIMFTNYSNTAFQRAAKKLGASYFFDKTNDVEKLIDTLKNISA